MLDRGLSFNQLTVKAWRDIHMEMDVGSIGKG